jgi:hypothetical protein
MPMREASMGSRTFATDDLRELTDVQLIHRLHVALAAREKAATPASRAARLIRSLPRSQLVLPALVAVAVQMRDAAHGSALAMALASPERLIAWAEKSRARMDALLADIAILRMMREMQRRIPARGMMAGGWRPLASR